MSAVYRLPFNTISTFFWPGPWKSAGNWDSPIKPHGIAQPFAWDIGFSFSDDPRGYFSSLHAARAGTVINLRDNYLGSSCNDPNKPEAGPGNFVTVRHADDTVFAYCHMQAGSIEVSVGQYVEQGTKLGVVGATGNVCPPGNEHVHMGALSRIDIGTIGDFKSIGGGGSIKYGTDVISHFEDTASPTSPSFHKYPWRPLGGDTYHPNPLLYRQDGWRFCNQCAGLIFAYQGSDGICPATGGPHKYRTPPLGSRNYTLSDDVQAPGEPNWKYCRKCHVLFYDMPGSRCPVTTPTNQHDPSASGNYRIIKNISSDPGQHGWRLCSKCKAMFFVNATQSKCPQGGQHFAGNSGDYSLHMSYEDHQRDWRYCSKCKGLFLKTDASNGVCAAGGGHFVFGSNYILAMDVQPVNINDPFGPWAPTYPPDFPGWHANWRYCYKCRLLFYGPDIERSVCPAGGPHFGGSQPTYYLVAFGALPSGLGQTGWRQCSKCQSLWLPPTGGSACPAFGGGTHSYQGGITYVLSFDGFP
jgi:hypothetical protein